MKNLLLLLLCAFSLSVSADQIEIKRNDNILDISEFNATDTLYIENNFKVDALMGLQILFKGVTGTADGTLNIYETNDLDELYMEVASSQLPYTISAADESIGFTKDGLPYKYIVIILDKNGMTGGEFKTLLNIKQY